MTIRAKISGRAAGESPRRPSATPTGLPLAEGSAGAVYRPIEIALSPPTSGGLGIDEASSHGYENGLRAIVRTELG